MHMIQLHVGLQSSFVLETQHLYQLYFIMSCQNQNHILYLFHKRLLLIRVFTETRQKRRSQRRSEKGHCRKIYPQIFCYR